jgi:hypothetical protein
VWTFSIIYKGVIFAQNKDAKNPKTQLPERVRHQL